jgi:tripartite-type tricarboxylate transporter receptor subunit TctC
MATAAARIVAGATALVLVAGTAFAQAWPSRPVRLVVPFASGGSTDVAARLLGGEMTRTLGQPIVVENRAGGAGALAAEYVAKAAPDGYTLCFCTTGPMALIPILDPKLPYDPLRDFAPVSHVLDVENVIIARPDLAASDVRGLVALAKGSPDRITFGTPGPGGPQHLGGELLNTMAGVRLVHVPFKGEGPAIAELLGGRIDIVFASMVAALPQIRAGKVKALAVPHAARSRMLPDVPTVAEAGYPGYAIANFIGISAPAGTPPAAIERLYESVRAALAVPAVQERLAADGLAPIGSRPEAYADMLKRAHERWSGVIRQAGLTRQ